MSKTKKQILWVSFILLILAIPAIAWVSPKLKRKPEPTTERPMLPSKVANSIPPVNKSKERVEGEVVGITPHGFEPSEITRPHKHFILVIDNRSGLAQIELRLDREQGGRLREVQIAREKRNWSDDLDLQPGRYVLSESSHPSWLCHITVTAN